MRPRAVARVSGRKRPGLVTRPVAKLGPEQWLELLARAIARVSGQTIGRG